MAGIADVARVETQAVHARLECGQGQPVLEVDVGDDRYRRSGDDLRQPLGRLTVVAGDADDVGPGRRQGVRLGQGGIDVCRLRRRHRLHGDRSIATDRDAADEDLAGVASLHDRNPIGHPMSSGSTMSR